jgi:hypothetical protein
MGILDSFANGMVELMITRFSSRTTVSKTPTDELRNAYEKMNELLCNSSLKDSQRAGVRRAIEYMSEELEKR